MLYEKNTVLFFGYANNYFSMATNGVIVFLQKNCHFYF